MTGRYCPNCYRSLPDGSFCAGCLRRAEDRAPLSRAELFLGVIGAPVLFTGVLTLNGRLCTVGAVIAAAAVLMHLVRVISAQG